MKKNKNENFYRLSPSNYDTLKMYLEALLPEYEHLLKIEEKYNELEEKYKKLEIKNAYLKTRIRRERNEEV